MCKQNFTKLYCFREKYDPLSIIMESALNITKIKTSLIENFKRGMFLRNEAN